MLALRAEVSQVTVIGALGFVRIGANQAMSAPMDGMGNIIGFSSLRSFLVDASSIVRIGTMPHFPGIVPGNSL